MVNLRAIPESSPSQPVASTSQLKSNPEGAPWVVQKYGGTSLGKFLDNIANETIPSYLEQGNRVAVVCSARSGSTKLTGTTNLLIRASLEALRPSGSATNSTSPNGSRAQTPSANSGNVNPLSMSSQVFQRSGSSSVLPTLMNGGTSSWQSRSNSPSPSSPVGRRSMSNSFSSLRDEVMNNHQQQFESTVEQIRSDHIASARAAVKNPEILDVLQEEIDADCDQLRSFLMAAQILEEISPRSKDTIIGVGERLSCRIVAATLRDRGIDSEMVSLEAIIQRASEDDEQPTEAAPADNESLGQPFWDRLAKLFGERLQECGDRVPVVTGFFGVVPGSLLSQVGRGYTDLCAALCAVGLNAAELQIWKEVDGIFTADPRKVIKARLLPHITPEEAAELTYYGSEVIHPFTMEQVINASIPIRIKNVERPSGAGTIIYPDISNSRPGTPPSSALAALAFDRATVAKIPTAVTIKDSILVLNVRSNRKTISHTFLSKIFGTLDRFGIVVDLISTSEVHVSIALNGSMRRQLLDKVVNELRKVGEVYVLHEMAILSLVGKQMKNMVGIAGRMFTTLADAKVNIEMISQGSSEINVSCVIAARDSLKALKMVHRLLEID